MSGVGRAASDRLTVLLVDDEALMRSGLRLLLEGAPELSVVGEAADGREALAAIARLRPAVVLMDIRMPVMSGLEALAELGRQRHSAAWVPPVVMLTALDTDAVVLTALRAGAAGFLLKSASPPTLVAAVRAAAAGQPIVSPQVLRQLVDLAGPAVDPRSDRVPSGPRRRVDLLSPREREIAGLVAEGLTNQEIAGRLFVTLATVKTHLGRLMEKLEAGNRVQVAIAVLEDGGSGRPPDPSA